jgi:RecA/RadA recombinase
MSKLRDKLLSKSTIKLTSMLDESIIFAEKDMIPTPVPAFNIALSGKINGGLTPGVTTFAGPSKHFKSAFVLLAASSYLKQYDDAVLLFYDTEFGTPQGYFESFGIDMSRVVHTPITDIEELKHDMTNQLANINRGDKVIIILDSIGQIASKKEVDDAMEGKSAADMTRAKQIKSFFRLVTPHLTLKNLPFLVVNHVYKEIGMYPKDILSGGTGNMYASDNIFFVGRQQEKDGDTLAGYNFILNVEKSRYVREKSKIPIEVTFDGGIRKWSGLLDIALETGHVIVPTKGWYAIAENPEKKYRRKDTYSKNFWNILLADPTFHSAVETRYKLSSQSLLSEEETDEPTTGDTDAEV